MNKEERRAYSKAYYEANRCVILAKKKAHREANKEVYRARARARFDANKEDYRARAKARYYAVLFNAFQAGAAVGYRHGNESRLIENAFREWLKRPRKKEAAQR